MDSKGFIRSSITLQIQSGSKTVAGSLTGGTKDTQETIDFCAENRIYPNIEVTPMEYVNEALERLIKRDVKYRLKQRVTSQKLQDVKRRNGKIMSSQGVGEDCLGWAARDASGVLSPYKFSRSHEIAGIVTKVGSNVHRFNVGDHVGVGAYLNSCRDCE
ncbi:hypothetical protein Fmac_009976 [Flemingia macrophylla]|uniref:Alcohol dehydrogenase-like N-terminal domain-containing protein n=1 Tax=Flemingia macrophylla TaxID=520843 RepID=A0ABD1N1S2_9FABA